ncbi:Zona pellucida domain-containing protein [Strongyloides ratti]|uniref:Zona pellucida domain-containing protein n=1 Tax=Strongyloides ratti TaxID=34506 RepID=A0A090KY34_STRRB|nr:Zona pellucida domain-containing protein [Strongyloides ratti]CEF62430.1 Zona pellucida domain-containing protein [Strongyloides ratti]
MSFNVKLFYLVFFLLYQLGNGQGNGYFTTNDYLQSQDLFDEENGIIGVPDIKCNAETIEMRFKTKNKFMGKVYVRGHYNNPECKVDYAQASLEGLPIDGIKLHHGSCDMDRQRVLKPGGMQFSTVLVISFHPLFITKTDRAFNINCLYRESETKVQSELEVSQLQTESIAHDMPLPTCTYTIRKDLLDGPILKYAKVGDQVVHRWECDSDMYGMLVHSCYVEDGQGEKQMVIDNKGCHTDRLLLGDPTYVEALNMAYREGYVFKFADRVAVRFQCEIKLCAKEGGGCNGITPPACSSSINGNSITGGMTNNNIPKGTTTISTNMYNAPNRPWNKKISKRSTKNDNITIDINKSKLLDTDLFSQYVYVLDDENTGNKEVLDLDNKSNSLPLNNNNPVISVKAKVCMSMETLKILILFFVILAFIATYFIVLTICKKRQQAKNKESTINNWNNTIGNIKTYSKNGVQTPVVYG